MAYYILPTLTTEFNLFSANDVWYLNPGASINTTDSRGIDINGQTGSTLVIAGFVSAVDAIDDSTSTADNVTIIVEAGATVQGTSDAIEALSGNDGWTVTNNGTLISGGDAGVEFGGNNSFLSNFGDITSDSYFAVYSYGNNNTVVNAGDLTSNTNFAVFSSGKGFEFTNSGSVTGVVGVNLGSNGGNVINSGTITGTGGTAIQSGSGAETIINSGVIDGDVFLGGGADLINTIEGSVTGTINTGGGADTILASAGEQTVIAGGGGDFIRTGANNDSVRAGGGADLVLAGAGADNIRADSGDDVVFGGSGADVIRGGGGNDVIHGGKGSDILYGNAGTDVFVFGLVEGSDKIKDWEDGSDRIDLTEYGVVSFAALSGAISSSGGDAVIDLSALGGSGTIVVENAAGLLDASDFIL